MFWYLDASAFVKLVLGEPESSALRTWLAGQRYLSSELMRTEVLRAARRRSEADGRRASEQLERIELLSVERADYVAAGWLDPSDLRSLDALHLTVAATLGPELAGLVTYDRRMAAAARARGLSVAAPTTV